MSTKKPFCEYRVKAGTIRYEGKTYKAGQTFTAYQDLSHIKNKLVRVGSPEDQQDAPLRGPVGPKIIKSDEDEGRYDVIGADGEKANEKSLTKKQAAALVGQLILADLDDDEEENEHED